MVSKAAAPVSIGLIADVQYADKPNSRVDHRDRYYNEAAYKLEHAVAYFNVLHKEKPLRCVLNLGDVVDGNWTEERTVQDFEVVLRALEECEVPELLHVIGNHCLDVGRSYLMQRLWGDKHKVGWYEWDLSDLWRFLVLDTTEVSIDGASACHRVQARKMLASPWRDPAIQPWNGMVGDDQRAWLVRRIANSRVEGKHVVVVGHHPVSAKAADDTHITWDNHEARKLLEENCDVVKAYFAGHYHPGGYSFEGGVHHVTFQAIVEAWDNAYAVVDFYDDKIVIKGHGSIHKHLELPIQSFTFEDCIGTEPSVGNWGPIGAPDGIPTRGTINAPA